MALHSGIVSIELDILFACYWSIAFARQVMFVISSFDLNVIVKVSVDENGNIYILNNESNQS